VNRENVGTYESIVIPSENCGMPEGALFVRLRTQSAARSADEPLDLCFSLLPPPSSSCGHNLARPPIERCFHKLIALMKAGRVFAVDVDRMQ